MKKKWQLVRWQWGPWSWKPWKHVLDEADCGIDVCVVTGFAGWGPWQGEYKMVVDRDEI